MILSNFSLNSDIFGGVYYVIILLFIVIKI